MPLYVSFPIPDSDGESPADAAFIIATLLAEHAGGGARLGGDRWAEVTETKPVPDWVEQEIVFPDSDTKMVVRVEQQVPDLDEPGIEVP